LQRASIITPYIRSSSFSACCVEAGKMLDSARRTEAAAVVNPGLDLHDDFSSTSPRRLQETGSTHSSLPPDPPTSPSPHIPPTHTLPHTPPASQSLPPPLTLLTLHPYHVAIPPVAGAVSQGFLVTGFLPLGAPGAYIHATHSVRSTLHTIHVLPTRGTHFFSPLQRRKISATRSASPKP
jgi:hypothetical protein